MLRGIAMATLTISIDDQTKSGFVEFCKNVGLTPTGAINLFATTVVNQQRIPFEIAVDPFYGEANRTALKQGIAELEKGDYVDVPSDGFLGFVEGL
jgi:DNA-damage-inducible protein J